VSATAQAHDVLGNEASSVVGSHPAEDAVRTVAVMGSPVETLLDVVKRENAGLLVVGNRGLNGIEGRLLGSVPADATPRSPCAVLVAHTTD
jgi:nucleotide-binding universal stress UspA family protein